MRNAVVAALAAIVCTSTSAPAQDRRLSEQEERYAWGLSERLARPLGRVRRVTVPAGNPFGLPLAETPGFTWVRTPGAPPFGGGPRAQVPGVQVDLGSGRQGGGALTLARFRFPSEKAAQEHLAAIAHRPGEHTVPLVAEVRGDQVLLVTGEALRDPQVARRVRETMWDGLPALSRVSDASVADLGGRNLAVTTTLTEGALVDAIEQMRRALGAHPAVPGGARVGPEGASLWLARDLAQVELVRAHLDALGGHPSQGARRPAAGTPGAAGALDGLFGGAP